MTDWKLVQSALLRAGFDPGPIDGVRGARTDAALVAFKKSIGLKARPFFGPLTREALLGEVKGGADLPWMAQAQAVRGLHERRDTARLRGWFSKVVAWIDPREVPWCGAFAATCFRRWDGAIELPENPLGARNWGRFGREVEPVFGAVLVFWRGSRNGWKGHVGFYVGEDETHYHVLGGNQSDAVTVTRISKDRLLSARWPLGVTMTGGRVYLDASGIPVSENEA